MLERKLCINTSWCKGCGICATFCPKKVLEIKNGKVVIVNQDCIFCKTCESLCPDYAIYVNETEKDNE